MISLIDGVNLWFYVDICLMRIDDNDDNDYDDDYKSLAMMVNLFEVVEYSKFLIFFFFKYWVYVMKKVNLFVCNFNIE